MTPRIHPSVMLSPNHTHPTYIPYSTNLATAKQTAATAANGPARHDLLVAAYRLFDAALQPWAGAAAATATEGDERRRVLLLMVRLPYGMHAHVSFLLLAGSLLTHLPSSTYTLHHNSWPSAPPSPPAPAAAPAAAGATG